MGYRGMYIQDEADPYETIQGCRDNDHGLSRAL